MDVLAIIPARGGSKSIPRKNLLEMGGKPLIAHSIRHAEESERVTRLIVSTDDEEIAEVARKFGAEVPFIRPAEYATDQATDLDVFRHALGWLDAHEGYRPPILVHLRPTNPIREPKTIDSAVDMLVGRPDCTSVRSVSMSEFTPYKMWEIKDGVLDPVSDRLGVPGGYSVPRQVLPKVYWQNGHIDVTRWDTVMRQGSMTGDRVLPLILEEPIHELDYPDQISGLEEAMRKTPERTPGRMPR